MLLQCSGRHPFKVMYYDINKINTYLNFKLNIEGNYETSKSK